MTVPLLLHAVVLLLSLVLAHTSSRTPQTNEQCSTNFYDHVCSAHVEEPGPKVYSEIGKLSAALGNFSAQTVGEVSPSEFTFSLKDVGRAFRSSQSSRHVSSTGSVLPSSPTGTIGSRRSMWQWLSPI
jgi:hypothetical protein